MQKESPELQNDPEMNKLIQVIKEFRDEELEHKDTAVEHDAHQAPLYPVVSQLIQAGCKVAIKVAERI